uniref:SAC3/GANP/THP3 conserved domain-containing protein n=1 Tax=Acrobeloides nanus TaxID=290746 RepID=A0A914E682_9BILA
MCPESEIHFRLKNNIIHPLETDNPWEAKPARRRKPIPELMVKEYTRPAADKHIHPDSLRSFSALKKTISYLLSFKSEFTNSARWPIAYYFIKDRFRAVRQDLIVQRLPASQSIELLEEMIPFYLESEYRCELQQTPNYDRKLHKTELEECFSRWKSALDSLEEKKFSRDMMLAYFLHHIDDSSFRYEILKWETALSDLTSTFNDLYFSICIGNYICIVPAHWDVPLPCVEGFLCCLLR